MKEKVPTVEEIRELKKMCGNMSFEEMDEAGIFKDNRKMVMRETMTEILMRHSTEESKEEIWKLCKKLAAYAHAPVSLAEYKRVRTYAENPIIVNVVLNGLRENYYPFMGQLIPDVQGYYYCIALISQSAHNRTECLEYLTELTNYFITELSDEANVLKRNMKVLKKEYKDLEELYKKLNEANIFT